MSGKLCIVLFVLSFQLIQLEACGSILDYNKAELALRQKKKLQDPDPDTYYEGHSFNGFDLDANTKRNISLWLKSYREQLKKERDNITQFGDELTPGWFKPGEETQFTGMIDDIPVWAYLNSKNRNAGTKLEICLHPLMRGSCAGRWFWNSKKTRYAYNVITDECISFKYEGCGANANHFMTKLECERKCIASTENLYTDGCDASSHIPLDYTNPNIGFITA